MSTFLLLWKLKTLKSTCTYPKVILTIFFILEDKNITSSCWQKEHTNEKRGREQKEIVFAHSMAQFCKVFFYELVNNTKGKNWWPPVWTSVCIFLNCKRASYKARNTTYLSHPTLKTRQTPCFSKVSWWLWHLKTRRGWTPSSKSILGGAEIAKKCYKPLSYLTHCEWKNL